MKPIAICRHEATQGPGFIQTFLESLAVPHRLFAIDAGDTPPRQAGEFSAVIVLGSNASANDGHAWLRREDALLADALRLGRPILGHCFGGQMLARALGAKVRRNSVPQIGWGRVLTTVLPQARHWLGERRELEMFHWHFDTFGIPRGAQRILFGSYCINKGFALGPHLGLQSHLEVTVASVRAWCAEDRAALHQWQHLPSVQGEAAILHDLDARVARLHVLAGQVYRQWLRNVEGAALLPAPPAGRPHGGEGWGRALARG
ncbi:type 1 glutamine amidotransferase [Chitinilyticum litopenaei]|uniref:type 1 glutamine amidotransferase n=1 Tax=Chitinilyticum litopenaei TaxID=1121276 RepID=UPI00041B6674|nr:type 1 glutamine amidotransferase [Chitinilyticum litopenaei]